MSSFRQFNGVKPTNIGNSSKTVTNRRHSFSTAGGTVTSVGNARVPLRNRGSRLSPALPSVSTDNASMTGSAHGANVPRRRISLDKVRLCSYCWQCILIMLGKTDGVILSPHRPHHYRSPKVLHIESFMVALCNRADHIYFHTVSFFFCFFLA